MTPTTDFTNLDHDARFQLAFDAGYFEIQAGLQNIDPVDGAKCQEMYIGWTNLYRHDPYLPVEAEAERTYPIPNSDYASYGKLDTLVTMEGDPAKPLIMIEHKTGSSAADSERVYPFITASLNSQITNYCLLQSATGEPLDHTVIDYSHVPYTKPKRIVLGKDTAQVGTLREVRGQGKYFGFELSSPTKKHYRDNKNITENVECYRYRLRYEIDQNPTKYFARKGPIYRGNLDLIEQLQKQEQLTRDIDRAIEEEDLGAFYKNTNNCMSFNSKCQYFSLCEGTSVVDSDDWEPRKGAAGSGSKNLSYSKASCFMSCRRKFYYRYVKGIQKREGDTRSLRIGSLFHIGLEHYYRKLIEMRKGGIDD